jgi:ATP-dependent exoDNAse (exonuclease V) alpha subunit
MLLVNLSAKLVNGLRGTVVCLNEDHVEVNFKSIGNTVKIFPCKFSMYSPEKGMDIATRKQIPITLAFAITSHKAQGWLCIKFIDYITVFFYDTFFEIKDS